MSIKSKLMPLTRLHIVPEWRDDGHLSLTQWMDTGDTEAEVTVTHESDKMTSIGRTASHLSVCIYPQESAMETDKNDDKGSGKTSQEIETFLRGVDEPMVITDNGELEPDSEEWHGSNVRRVEYSDGITHVSPTESPTPQKEPSLTLTAVIPEKCNVSCELLQGGAIVIDKKVEGDAFLTTTDGNVSVNKLRGHEIFISAKGTKNTILATDLLEAEKLDIESQGRVRAKKIHGSQVKIRVDRQGSGASFVPTHDADDEGSLVDISSVYVAGNGSAEVCVSSSEPSEKCAVRVKSHHGHVAVETTTPFSGSDPCVELGGVNGSFDVMVQEPKSATGTIKGLAGRIHVDSLSRDSVSVLHANEGDVSLTLDRKAEADLRLLSSSEITSFDSGTILVEDDDPSHVQSALRDLDSRSTRPSSQPRIRIDTSAFNARSNDDSYQNLDYVDGWIENKSNEPDSRFDLTSKGGKIQLQGAAEQALQGFSSSNKGASEIARPLVAIATNGNISLESLSWFGAIARRYGLEEDRENLGRTATRSGRPLVP